MQNIYEILARAAALRDETQLNSISPERAGGIMYDTLLALNDLWLQQGAALVISKIYASVAAMEADTAPVSDLTGQPLRPGQIVVIASSDSDNGSVYRYNGTDSPSWSLVGEIGNLEPVDSLDSDSTQLPLAAHQGKVLDGKISQLGQYINNPRWVKVVTDNDDKILYGVKSDGKFYFGNGCPPQIQEYVQNQINAIGIDSLLATKVDKVTGKSLIDADFASSQSATENPDWLRIITDKEGRIIEGIKKDGTKVINTNLVNPKVDNKVDKLTGKSLIDSNYAEGVKFEDSVKNLIYAIVDEKDNLLFGITRDAELYTPRPLVKPKGGDKVIVDDNIVEGSVLSPYSSPVFGNELMPLASLSKKGFLVFRTDDDTIMPEVTNILESFGYRYSMCINILCTDPNNILSEETRNFYRGLQQKGHEMCDHTPNNTTFYCDILPEWEKYFTSYLGTDIRNITNSIITKGARTVFFDYESVDSYTNFAYGVGNTYSVNAGDNKIYGDFTEDGIADMNLNSTEFRGIYVYIENTNGDVKKGWHIALKPSGITNYLQVVDGIGNPVNFGTNANINMYVTLNDAAEPPITLTENATYLLILCGQLWWTHFGFEHPKTWTTCGGIHPQPTNEYVSDAIRELGLDNAELRWKYNCATYGFADGNPYPRACMNWVSGDWGVLHFDGATETDLDDAKAKIAECVALKQVVTIASHYRYSDFVGGRDGYIKFIYDIFKFVKENRISIVTLSQRNYLLIDAKCDDYANVMPDLYTDMTGRGYPDGYVMDDVITTLVTSGGRAESKNRALQLNGNVENGKVLEVIRLGGITKGLNTFSFDYRGNCGSLAVSISGRQKVTDSPTLLLSETISASSVDWDSKQIDFEFPYTYCYLDISITSNGYVDGALISNLSIRKKM